MNLQSNYSEIQTEVILEQEREIEESLLLLDDNIKRFGTLRLLTLRQIQDTYAKSFKRKGINLNDVPPEVWIELRRTQSVNLKLDFHLKDDIEKTFASTFELDWTKFLIILGWISFFQRNKMGSFLKKKP